MQNPTVALLTWYMEVKRDLPWRTTKDAYAIWLSEIILQQTRVNQGMSYYMAFLEAYPNVESLANAPIEAVFKIWQGLGYYSRARNLHATAQHVAFNLKGSFPRTANELKTLKGIGPYTAAAIASIAFNEPEAAVDGNVFRVISRYYELDIPVDTPQGVNYVSQKAHLWLDKLNPGDFNQALMELGATICTPKAPNCIACPIQTNCSAFQHNTMLNYPVKAKRVKVKSRYINYIMLYNEDGFYFTPSAEKDIYKGLFSLYKAENEATMNLAQIQNHLQNLGFELENEPVAVWQTKHILTHQKLEVTFWMVEIKNLLKIYNKFLICNWKSYSEKPTSKLTSLFFQFLENQLNNINYANIKQSITDWKLRQGSRG